MRCFAVSIHTVHHRKLLPMCSRGSYGLQCVYYVYVCAYILRIYIYVFVCLDICMQTHRKYNFGMCIVIQYMHNLHTDTSAHQKLTHTHTTSRYVHTYMHIYIHTKDKHTYIRHMYMYVCMYVCVYVCT